MAKRKMVSRRRFFSKGRSHSRPKMTIPLAVVAGFASPIGRSISHFQSNGFLGEEGAIAEFSRTMIGINPYAPTVRFEGWRLRYGLLPVLLGLGVHKLANMVGINRMLASARIPLIRI